MADTEIVIPQALAPFQRVWTDVVERPLDIFPFPNQQINSSNCSQIIRFDFPGNQFLDVVHRPMYLEFNIQIAGGTALLAKYCGYLINTIRVFVNNELTEEILNVGQLNNLMQAMMETTDTQSNLAAELRGVPQSQFNVDYSITPIGTGLNAIAAGSAGNNAGGTDSYGYTLPVYFGQRLDNQIAYFTYPGIVVRIPIAPKGSFFSPPQGLIPLFRLPNVRIEFTFNPKQYVLVARGPVASGVGPNADTALPDYSITNMRISCMYAQSIAMAKVYSEPEWLQSFMGYYFYTVPLQSTNNLLPVVTAFKSSRYLVGVLANPAQFTGDQPSALIVAGTAATFIGGNPVYNAGQTTVLSDKNRFTSFYGMGGAGEGANVLVNNSAAGPIYGRDAYWIPNALNFQQNNEWIYQQDLTTRGQFFEEIMKVFPEVQHSVFFNTWNYPGIRGVIVINLQAPALKEQFICGNRAAEGQATSFIKLNLTRNLRDNLVTAAAPSTYLNTVQLMLWICFDKTLRVNMDTGLATVDS
jgi:hypothetical protein